MKNSALIIILLLQFLIIAVKAEETLESIDFSSPLIQAVVAYQDARRNSDAEAWWGMLAKDMQESYKSLAVFKEKVALRAKSSAYDALVNVQLKAVTPITDNRAWIATQSKNTGFYFIKEGGKWKFAVIPIYIGKVKNNLEVLRKAIREYYAENRKMPKTLSELLSPVPYVNNIPYDIFNDANTPYAYKVITKDECLLYSLGPDSDDDQGAVQYDSVNGLISNGDIILRYPSGE